MAGTPAQLGELRSPGGFLLGVRVTRRVSGRPGVSSRESRVLVLGKFNGVLGDFNGMVRVFTGVWSGMFGDLTWMLASSVSGFWLVAVVSLASRRISGRPGVSRRVAKTPGDFLGVMDSEIPKTRARSGLEEEPASSSTISCWPSCCVLCGRIWPAICPIGSWARS